MLAHFGLLVSPCSESCPQHQTTGHPKVVCLHCGALMYEDSLEDHYLQSPDHPSCKQCNRGFKDDRTWEEASDSTLKRSRSFV
jgi:hypothetical protein